MNNINDLREEIKTYFNDHGEIFEENLLSQAVNVSGKITEILEKGNIDLLKNARKLIFYIIDQNDKDLIAFAEEEGIAWAGHSLTLSLKLEWVQAIRRTFWKIIGSIDEEKNLTDGKKDFYEMEEVINEQIDQFLNSFLSHQNIKIKCSINKGKWLNIYLSQSFQ